MCSIPLSYYTHCLQHAARERAVANRQARIERQEKENEVPSSADRLHVAECLTCHKGLERQAQEVSASAGQAGVSQKPQQKQGVSYWAV